MTNISTGGSLQECAYLFPGYFTVTGSLEQGEGPFEFLVAASSSCALAKPQWVCCESDMGGDETCQSWNEFLNAVERVVNESFSSSNDGSDPIDGLRANIRKLVQTKRDELSKKQLFEGRTDPNGSLDIVPLTNNAGSIRSSNIDMDPQIAGKHALSSDRDGQAGGFLEALRAAARTVGEEESNTASNHRRGSETFSTSGSRSHHSGSGSNSSAPETSSQSSVMSSPAPQQPFGADTQGGSRSSQREKYFARLFPVYRKLFVHPTQPHRSGPAAFLGFHKNGHSSNRMLATALSPNTAHMLLCSTSQWSLYDIPADYNDGPVLRHTGSLPDLKRPYHVALNDNWFAVGSETGILTVFSIETGEELYTRDFLFPLNCLDISYRGTFISCAIVGVDKVSRMPQPMIVLVCTGVSNPEFRPFEHAEVITFTSPYQDPIKTLVISWQETSIVCSTQRESRFFVIGLNDPREPRLLMRSNRKPPPPDESMAHGMSVGSETDIDDIRTDNYEGITSVRFLPNNRYLIVTSNVPGAAPVILDSRLSTRRLQHGSHIVNALVATGQIPSIVMRIEKLGSAIHRAVVSPRGNAVAFLDTHGLVYVMNLPTSTTEPHKIVVCFDVAAAPTLREAASMRFSLDGTALLVVDRKGILHVGDFGAGLPSHAGVTRSRVLA